MLVALANKKGDPSAESMLKLLIAMYKSNRFNYKPNCFSYFSEWFNEAMPFIQKYGMTNDMHLLMEALFQQLDIYEQFPTQFIAALNILKNARARMLKDMTISKVQLDMFDSVRLAITGSESAEAKLHNDVSKLKDKFINKLFAERVSASGPEMQYATDDERMTYSELNNLTTRYGGNGVRVPDTVLKEWQAHKRESGNYLPEHERYLALHRERTAAYRRGMRNLIRGGGQITMDVATVREMLGDIQNDIPEWFVGRIDDRQVYYTTDNVELTNKPVGNGRMNPDFQPNNAGKAWYCEYQDVYSKTSSKVYTVAFRKDRTATRYEVVRSMLPDMDDYCARWLPDLKHGITTQRGACAYICELLYQTTARISSTKAATDGETTYGMTTLMPEHVRFQGSNVFIEYTGKSGGKQVHAFKANTERAKLLVHYLKELIKKTKRGNYLLTFRGKPIYSAQLNKYLRGELGFPNGFTTHMLRKLKGTQMAIALMAKHKFKQGMKVKDVEDKFREVALEVGKELGHMRGEQHTPITAIQSYIDPGVFEDVYDDLGLRPTSTFRGAIEKAKRETDTDTE